MAEIALPRNQIPFVGQSDKTMGSVLYPEQDDSHSAPVELLPNPDFVFPARPAEPALADPNTGTFSGRRPMSIQALPTTKRVSTAGMSQRRSVSALPNFTFNPAASTDAIPTTTPPHSPLPSPLPITPSRTMGHRRGGSEFIGGDGRSGGLGPMSTSPTKGDGILPPPDASVRLGPPSGRRGHAHRRSGAISCHDLQSVLQPKDANVQPRAGSAPATPFERDTKPSFSPPNRRTMSQSSLQSSPAGGVGLFREEPDSPTRRPLARARVGFSERIEYIRPLSTISSETETSLSTARGHSVSGSLSSLISAGASSPPTTRMARPTLNTTLEDESSKPRPTTAGAVLDSTGRTPTEFEGESETSKRPRSAIVSGSSRAMSPGSPGAPRTANPKKRNFFWLEHRRSEMAQSPALPKSVSEPSLVQASPESPSASSAMDASVLEHSDPDEDDSNTASKADRKPRKVKSWASSIMSRKARPQEQKSKPPVDRELSPPPRSHTAPPTVPASPLSFEPDFNFDIDDTVTLVSEPAPELPRPTLDTNIANWKPKVMASQDMDSLSPVIDLDAALGPFQTPQLGPASRSRHSRGASCVRKAPASGGFSGGLFGSTTQIHRRTESAPELAPFEFRKLAMASSSTMADVFEEDEEEDDVSEPKPSAVSGADSEERRDPSVGVQVVDTDNTTESRLAWDSDNGLRIQQDHDASKADVETEDESRRAVSRASSTQTAFLLRDQNTVEVVEDFEEPRTSDQSLTPTGAADEPKELLQPPMRLPLAARSHSSPDTFSSSAFSSPYPCSQSSFDTPRLGTAASSITDNRTLNSCGFGEPGPELRISVDDVPSLTSSRSTMTSAPHNPFPLPSPRSTDERSASMSSLPNAVAEGRRKRSSIASLSRLVSGSFGEKSKLSIEQRPQSEHPQPVKQVKLKKPNRLSRMIHFWRSKESNDQARN